MSKAKGPDINKWKEFRYNLVKEEIEIDADNEQDAQNWMNKPHEVFSYQLKNGKTLEIEEKDAPGMAGEQTAYVFLKIDDKNVRFDDVKQLMQPQDAKELEQYLDEVGNSKAANSDDLVREGKKPSKYFDVAKWRETHKK